jgi:ParB/RepB/Spo0J family partition protein
MAKKSKRKKNRGLRVLATRDIKIEDLIIGERFRPPRDEDAAKLAESVKTLGQVRPITARKDPDQDGKYIAVAGATFVKAAEMLGWTSVRADIVKCTEVQARQWEIAENLYRARLTALEEAKHIAEWVRLIAERTEVSRQNVAKPKGGRPEGAISKAARALPIKGKTQKARRKRIERRLKIASVSPGAEAAVREAGLDDNPSALREIANEETAEAQLDKIAAIVKRNAKKKAKRSSVKKSKAKADAPEEKAPLRKHPDDVIFAELKSETSANFRRTWAEARTKIRRRYLREVLKWEGGKPLADSA